MTSRTRFRWLACGDALVTSVSQFAGDASGDVLCEDVHGDRCGDEEQRRTQGGEIIHPRRGVSKQGGHEVNSAEVPNSCSQDSKSEVEFLHARSAASRSIFCVHLRSSALRPAPSRRAATMKSAAAMIMMCSVPSMRCLLCIASHRGDGLSRGYVDLSL